MSENSETIATADDLFGKPRCRRYTITDPLPIAGYRVRLRSVTEREFADYQLAVMKSSGKGFREERMRDATRRLIQLCVVDSSGNQIISDAQRTEMGEWDAADTAFLYGECVKHCGIDKDDIEGLVKNSEKTPVGS
jgi:hypothetical protein